MNVYDYLLQNKNRATVMALIRLAITQNYSFKGFVEDNPVFVSPNFMQWYEDGVMFFQGQKRFEGLIGLYENGEVKFAISSKDARKGDKAGPDDFIFISVDEIKERNEKIKPIEWDSLNNSVEKLEFLLKNECNDESKYQSLLEENPWMLRGAEYDRIDSHKIFDDRHIPDFSCVRIHDRFRDIIEIKAPFINLFRKDGNFASQFNEAWNQIEGYIDFALTEKDYLRRKGLRFENPEGYLLVGHSLTEEQREKIRAKERGNPRIKVFTYEEFLNFAKSTIKFFKNLETDTK